MNTQHHSNKVETYPSLLRHSIKECSDRGLYFASKWSAEQLTGLSSSLATTHSRIPFLPLIPEDCEIHSDLNGNSTIPPLSLGLHPEHDVYLLAKTYFDLKEFKRCAWVLQECQAPLHLFLWGYAMYLDGEKQLHDTLGPVLGDTDTHQSTNLALPIILEKLNMMNELHPITASDPWLLYLKALILYKARSMNAAFEVLMKSVVMYPLNWSAWTLLTQFMHSEAMFQTTLRLLPDSLVKQFFIVHTVLHQHFDTQHALRAFLSLESVFEQSCFVAGLRAHLFYEERNLRDAAIQFSTLLKVDPYRMEGMDLYGNALFVLQEKAELCRLCQSVMEIDKHRPETYLCIGNFYSCKNHHEVAAEYLRRAISLNRANGMAWVLLGHEYLELNMTEAATEAYRRATDLNPRDFQAWFGLGHIYNLLQLHPFSIEYSRRSLAIRPNDGRIWAHLANLFKKLGRVQDAFVAARRSVEVDPYYLDPNMYALLGKLSDTLEAQENENPREGDSFLIQTIHPHPQKSKKRQKQLDPNQLHRKVEQPLEEEEEVEETNMQKNPSSSISPTPTPPPPPFLPSSTSTSTLTSTSTSMSTPPTSYEWYRKAWDTRDQGTVPLHVDGVVEVVVYLTQHALRHPSHFPLVTKYMEEVQVGYPELSKHEKMKWLQADIRDRMQSLQPPHATSSSSSTFLSSTSSSFSVPTSKMD